MELKKNSTSFLLFQITAIMLCIIGITFAISYIMKSINVNLKTAPLAVDYTGSLTLPTVNLFPIEDSTVKTNTDNVLRVNFTVKGASSNPDIPIIYDVILSDLKVDKELKNKYFKWELEKNGVVISSGSLDPWFDRITNGKFWLTEIQQDLPKNNQTADNYEFRLWISESCSGDVTTCTEEMDQSNMLNKSISGKIETVLYTKGKKALVRKPGYNGSDYVESIFPNNKDTMNNDDPDGNIRYMGANPNNYVKFNDELWRIIGVFDVAKEEGGKKEKRLKIIRDEPIGQMAWDSGNKNDWSASTLQQELNTTYLSSLSGATKYIEPTVWNLGGPLSNEDITTSMFYNTERSNTVYEGRPESWLGTIGLMYPSDYGYATTGGATTNRNSCLSKELFNWGKPGYEDCTNNDYLHDVTNTQWTITPFSKLASRVFLVFTGGDVNYYSTSNSNYVVTPSIYLKSNTLFTKGTGSEDNPFELDIDKEETTAPKGFNLTIDKLEELGVTINSGTPDFNTVATTDEGIYSAEDDLGTSYYFRGASENNYVKFAGYYWRIIRINGDGTIRMIYDGTSGHANGESSTDRQLQDIEFNTNSNDNAYVGYMYGTPGSSTYEETHANTNDSMIKTANDNWYKTNIEDKGYSKYVADAIYCNDRSLSSGTGIGTVETNYMGYNRLNTNKNPSLKCTQTNDKFTISSSLGNGNLTYPVGLITADEIAYAGGKIGISNSQYYLYNGQFYWTASPYDFNGSSNVWYVYPDGDFSSDRVYFPNGLRPVISLKSDTTFSGNGTMDMPFEIVE